jgi:hypothetical protein
MGWGRRAMMATTQGREVLAALVPEDLFKAFRVFGLPADCMRICTINLDRRAVLLA